MPHGGHHEEEDDVNEWMHLLPPGDRRKVWELERARMDIERQIIHNNQAKLSGRAETDRQARRGSARNLNYTAPTADMMSNMYAQEVDVHQLAALLPKPGDGESERQLPVEKLLNVSHAERKGTRYAVLSILITLLAVAVYLYETSLDDIKDTMSDGWTTDGGKYPSWFTGMEAFFLAFFALDVVLGVMTTDDYWTFWTHQDTIVNVLCIVPSVLYLSADLRLWGFLRFLRLFRWCDLCTLESQRRSRRAGKEEGAGSGDGIGIEGSKREMTAAVLHLATFVSRFVLVFAGAALLLERAEGAVEDVVNDDVTAPLSFASAVYMSALLLTCGGGGFGPVPVSSYARAFAAVALLIFLPVAAVKLARVIRLSSSQHHIVRSSFRTPGVRERHVVACGSITAANLKARLKELFHVDHGQQNVRWVRVVVMSPTEPSPGVKALISSPKYRDKVTYVRGSPLDDDSLKRAGVDDAAAVMVLANKLSSNSHVEDMNVSLHAISVMSHVELQRRQGGGPRILVELVDPNAALHLRAAGLRHVVSSDQLKLSVLAQSCLCPGWSSVVANLLQSRAALPPQVLRQGSWLAEYYVGAKKSFYSVEFSPDFFGMLFGDAVTLIYEKFELILVAVESKRGGGGELVVIVNPSGGYRIGRGDRAFVLAETQGDARVVWDYMSAEGRGEDLVRASRSVNPEDEEVSALETLSMAGIANMGPQTFVDSMVQGKTLLRCQRKLQKGEAPSSALVLNWARQFKESDGMSDDEVVRKILAKEGLKPSTDEANLRDADSTSVHGGDSSLVNHHSTTAVIGSSPAHSRTGTSTPRKRNVLPRARSKGTPRSMRFVRPPTPGKALGGRPAASPAKSTSEDVLSELRSVEVESMDGNKARRRLSELQAAAETASSSGQGGPESSPDQGSSSDGTGDGEGQDLGRRISSARDLSGHFVVLGFPARPSHLECFLRPLRGWTQGDSAPGNTGWENGAGVPVVLVAPKIDRLESALEVLDRTGHIDTRRVYLLEGSPVSQRDLDNAGVRTARAVLVMKDPRRTYETSLDGEQTLLDAETLVSFIKMEDGLLGRDQHVVVELVDEANIRFLHSRAGAKSLHAIAGLGGGGAGGPADEAHYLWPKFASGSSYSTSCMDSLFGQAFFRPSRIALMERLLLLDRGDYQDIGRANMRRARERQMASVPASTASMHGADGAAGGGGQQAQKSTWRGARHVPIDSHHTVLGLSQHPLDSESAALLQNVKPTASLAKAAEAAAFETAAQIDVAAARRPSFANNEWNHTIHGRYQQQRGVPGVSSAGRDVPLILESCLRQMAVPDSFLGHSFGELYQHLAAPPLRCVAFALRRARGTRNAPEPYVYTGPRADTVLHAGDRVFVLGTPPLL